MYRTGRRKAAFTLVEVAIATMIVAITGLAIIAGVIYGLQSQQAVRERNGAMRAAADAIETTKKQLFHNLRPSTTTGVVIDDHGTPGDASDDVTATVQLRFFSWDGAGAEVELATLPLDRSMVMVEAVVTWNPAGYRSSRQQQVSLRTLLAP